MTKHIFRTITITTYLALISMTLSIFALGVILSEKKVVHTVVQVQEVVLANDKQRIDLFIDQLMTKKSASCFKKILNAESHFNPKAKNPRSSAIGVGQLLESTYRNIGLVHSGDPLAQVVASIAYISRHYGSSGTCAAWNSERINHSY